MPNHWHRVVLQTTETMEWYEQFSCVGLPMTHTMRYHAPLPHCRQRGHVYQADQELLPFRMDSHFPRSLPVTSNATHRTCKLVERAGKTSVEGLCSLGQRCEPLPRTVCPQAVGPFANWFAVFNEELRHKELDAVTLVDPGVGVRLDAKNWWSRSPVGWTRIHTPARGRPRKKPI